MERRLLAIGSRNKWASSLPTPLPPFFKNRTHAATTSDATWQAALSAIRYKNAALEAPSLGRRFLAVSLGQAVGQAACRSNGIVVALTVESAPTLAASPSAIPVGMSRTSTPFPFDILPLGSVGASSGVAAIVTSLAASMAAVAIVVNAHVV